MRSRKPISSSGLSRTDARYFAVRSSAADVPEGFAKGAFDGLFPPVVNAATATHTNACRNLRDGCFTSLKLVPSTPTSATLTLDHHDRLVRLIPFILQRLHRGRKQRDG